MNNFHFDYEGINPLNYKGKQTINDDLDEILKNTINTTIDWKKRENSLKKIGQICIGDQGKSDIFIKIFNTQLATNLGIQMADLRSSVMKEACRITSLCAMVLGIEIEQGVIYLLTQYVLFKIAGSANRVISDSSSKCILNLVKYVNSIKVINSICEQRSMKSNFVRNICAQCILYIVTCYKKNLIIKTNKILQDSMKSLLSDANGDVRATTRRAFITYRKRFQDDGDELFDILEKNVQKQIIEDEKKYGDSINVDSEDGGEIYFENSKNKGYLSGISNKSRSHEVKYNPKENINIDKACHTFQKEFQSEEIYYNKDNDTDSNLFSSHFSSTTEFSEKTQNEKNDDINMNMNKLRVKGNKSYKGSEIIKPNSCISNTMKVNNNKELLKKLNDKFYKNNYQNFNVINNFINSNDTNYEKEKKENNNNDSQKNIKQYNLTMNKTAKPKKFINKNNLFNNNNNNVQNSNDLNNNNNKNNSNNLQNKQKNLNINNYTQNNNNNNNNNNYYNNINSNFNVNKDSIEYKLIDKINQLSIYNNIKEKIKIFQFLFNSFNDILTDVKNISDITLRQFVDIHIEYMIYEDKSLTEQIIKNLMRMIYYLTQIFTSNDIKIIVKLLMMKINIGEKSVSKLSYELLDIIRKKWKIEDIYDGIFNLLEEKKSGYNDICYEFLTLLIYFGKIFEDINYLRKIMEIICSGDMSSKKLGKLIEALYKKDPKNFALVLKEQNYEEQKKILGFLDNKTDNVLNEIKQNQSEPIKNNNNSGKIKIIMNPKLNTNSNNNKSSELEDIKQYIENGNVKSFLDYIENRREYLPKFFMLLTDEKFLNPKYIKNILNFLYSLISMSDNLSNDISQNLEILIDQLVRFSILNVNNSFIVDMVKEILIIIPHKINNEKFYKSISKYLNNKTNIVVLQIILIAINSNIVNDKSKNLEKQLPFFIEGVLNLLNHPSSDVRKHVVHCCVELYMVLEHKFDVYMEMLPMNQQNLINHFIKKKSGY